MTVERLQKVMAHAGVASRRQCETLIEQGYVQVNGKLITELGYKVSPTDRIEVDGKVLNKEKPVYYVFHKPTGVISSVKDDKGRKVVLDYFDGIKERIYPIGRLDYDTSGLLLLTNDGQFAQQMMHPKHQIDKVYVAKVKGIPKEKYLRKLERGVFIEGKRTSPAKATIRFVDEEKQIAEVELTIHEGWNHQVKKMLASIGHPVIKLRREKFGNVTLKNLQAGHYRPLKDYELEKLKKMIK